MIRRRMVRVHLLVMLGALATCASTSQAQVPTATFVKTLGGFPADSHPSLFASVNGIVLFSACTSTVGCELWKTDGTLHGTALVKDILTGPADSQLSEFTRVNAVVFFTVRDLDGGRELWKSDGTTAGTVRVKDIAPNTNSDPRDLTDVNGTLFFTALDAAGRELWKSDGTEAGTVRVKDIQPGSGWCECSSLTNVNGVLFFSASDGVSGIELWKSDGTDAGTVQLTDAVPGPANSSPTGLVNVNGTLYFSQIDDSAGRELWKSDGTTLGTVRVKDIVPGPSDSGITGLIANGSTLFFLATTPANGLAWWKSDGSDAGTTLVFDPIPGPQVGVPVSVASPTVGAGALFFFVREGLNGERYTLWKLDGNGAVALEELQQGRALTVVGQTVFFATPEGLWQSDGTPGGTTLVKSGLNISANDRPVALDGLLVFAADDGLNGVELWKSDGTAFGTAMVADINPMRTTELRSVATVNGITFFVADPGTTHYQLWKTDGTNAGTTKLTDADLRSFTFPELAALNGTVIFEAEGASFGAEIWKSDGSPAGTALLKDLLPGLESDNVTPRSSHPSGPMTINNVVVFTALGEQGWDLWKTDGTAAGTMPVIPNGPSPMFSGSRLDNLVVMNNSVFFYDSASVKSPRRLWKTDGTAAGTILVTDKYVGGLTRVGNTLYFTSGRSLYKTDGTAAGTVLVSALGSNPNAERPIWLTDANGTLFFTLDGKLWKSDGTDAGTVPVLDASLAPVQGEVLVSMGATVFFRSHQGGLGNELWKTDGTPAGTVRVKDIRPGPEGSEPISPTVLGAQLFFGATDGVHGTELWVSDGTDAGTKMVADIWPGAMGSNPNDFKLAGNMLLVTASDPIRGRQLWKVTAGGTPTLDTDGDGLPDAWETAYGFNPLSATGDDGPNGDPDLDGRSNLLEYIEGTHPKIAATLWTDKTTLRFGAVGTTTSFSARTAAQTVVLNQQGSGSLSWSVVADQPWLQISPATGTGPASLSVTVRPDASLSSSGGTAWLRFFLTSSDRPFQEIAVTLDVKPAGGSTPPIGLVDTPTDNRTGVTGAVPFTGWALDDVDVARVTICRAAIGGESAPVDPNCGNTAQIFVGSAVFIDGARPDVEVSTAAYPRNGRAGWGFMVLTNMLPNQGNGTFNFSVYAQDVEGQTRVLGTRTMTCDNAHATLPFGTIDTPLQGGVASGTQFVNFGWALTPMPKSIPVDGSTITVVVDGAAIGQVNYNHARPDIDAIFPGYANTNGAVGYRIIDTTGLSNGLHTISWTVADSGGAIAGIGSRFFTVANGVGAVTASTERHAVAAMSAEAPSRPDLAVVEETPWDETPLIARRGWDLEGPWHQFPVGRAGRAVIRGEELDRFELWLGARGRALSGYLRVGDALKALPAGSRLDTTTGTFTWAPGAGFVGGYDVVFVQWDHGRAVSRREVRFILAAKGSGHVGVQVEVDTPRQGASVAQPFLVGGWAADLDAASGTGIDTLHVWAYPLAGGPPVFLGTPNLGGPRVDVATVHGEQFRDSGFGLMVQGLTPGAYDLAVFPWSNVTGAFAPPKMVRVTIP